MIIYLEGPDGSGKSTLASKLEEMCIKENLNCNKNAEQLIPTRPNNDYRIKFDTLMKKLIDLAESSVINILDRGPISDNLYRIFDNYEPVGKMPDYINLFKALCCKHQLYIIYCKTDKAEEAMLQRGDDNPIAINKHREISKAYDMLMGILYSYFKNNMSIFDYSQENATEIILYKVKDFIKEFICIN